MSITYTKTEILASKKYTKYKDIVNGLLDDKKEYTLKEVNKIVFDYLKKEV